LALTNWQALVALLAWAGERTATSVLDIGMAQASAAALPVAALAAASVLAWLTFGRRGDLRVATEHVRLLRLAAVAAIAVSLGRSAFTPVDGLLAIVTFACLTASELLAACRTGR